MKRIKEDSRTRLENLWVEDDFEKFHNMLEKLDDKEIDKFLSEAEAQTKHVRK